MQIHEGESGNGNVAALLRVAAYLSQPQQFLAVADARAELRQTLSKVKNGSVVLTTHGEPEAAVVPFATLEDMRLALMQLLVAEIEASLLRAHEPAVMPNGDAIVPTTEEELDALVAESVRNARRLSKQSRRKTSVR